MRLVLAEGRHAAVSPFTLCPAPRGGVRPERSCCPAHAKRVGQGDMFYSMIRNDMEHRSSCPARRERARAALAKVNTAHTVIHDNGT
jgi:hypothetical protein